jgi:hypothetical protein
LGSEDSEYKKSVLDLCNSLAVEKNWHELELGQHGHSFIFEMLDEKSWQERLNALMK